jgi:hypothetical protein
MAEGAVLEASIMKTSAAEITVTLWSWARYLKLCQHSQLLVDKVLGHIVAGLELSKEDVHPDKMGEASHGG